MTTCGIDDNDYWIDKNGVMRDSFGAEVDKDGFPLEENYYSGKIDPCDIPEPKDDYAFNFPGFNNDFDDSVYDVDSSFMTPVGRKRK